MMPSEGIITILLQVPPEIRDSMARAWVAFLIGLADGLSGDSTPPSTQRELDVATKLYEMAAELHSACKRAGIL